MKMPLPSTKTSLQLYLFLCLAVLPGLSGCHKSNVNGLYGQWRWVRTDWTFTVSSGTAYPPPLTTVVLQINIDGTFSISKNGTTQGTGTYQLSKSCPGGNCTTVVTFQNQYAQNATQGYYWVVGNYLYSVQNNDLVLTFDGPFSPAGAGSIQYFIPY